MAKDAVRWVLAFDASCGKCQGASDAVRALGHDVLSTAPLNSLEVVAWRKAALGPEPPWVPTLLRVRGLEVKAWTGRAMAVRLALLLKPRNTIRLMKAFADTADGDAAAVREAAPRSLSRASFLKLAAGFAVAGGLIATRPSAAVAAEADPVYRWLRANIHALPAEYDEVVSFPVAYRKAIFANSTPAIRSRLWVADLEKFLSDTKPTGGREALVRRFLRLAADEAVFGRKAGDPRQLQALRALGDEAVAEFGAEEAKAIFATLGPLDAPEMAAAARNAPAFLCDCALDPAINHCGRGNCCKGPCEITMSGCGWLWDEPCLGVCTC